MSVDILSYFKQLLPVLENDESLYCISAWNDQVLLTLESWQWSVFDAFLHDLRNRFSALALQEMADIQCGELKIWHCIAYKNLKATHQRMNNVSVTSIPSSPKHTSQLSRFQLYFLFSSHLSMYIIRSAFSCLLHVIYNRDFPFIHTCMYFISVLRAVHFIWSVLQSFVFQFLKESLMTLNVFCCLGLWPPSEWSRHVVQSWDNARFRMVSRTTCI